ncbi:STAS domain-containing protein [Cellulomonas fengjieae]|uniref:STAS domain-containing protein n=1 Tax=Cellulomonas fengjieae TaxID=2819978 RepID=A0ABS3SIA2_9CELL|nr:STAS domain-containing protein [Cellulomonas fengjieae]MBO3085483.1 STAS domain-containing protein [Cellulomonas fengjieae]MBO3102567.1 STAS domain-containing protein [Cellulomonas fengjieae]QVI64470.1 STAS domain-containing protein [Cellulomonas fengjieae]
MIRTPFAQIRVTTSADSVLIAFSGELDHSLTEEFTPIPAALKASGLPVRVDLSEVTFFGAWAVRALLALRAAAPGGVFTVLADSDAVRRTVVASGVTDLVPLVGSTAL